MGQEDKTTGATEYVEDVIVDDAQLSIEDTDASRTAWLISVTVSMGAFYSVCYIMPWTRVQQFI
jgi:hypothetical protein